MNMITTFILSIFANIYKIQSSWFWEIVAVVTMVLLVSGLTFLFVKYKNKRNVKQAVGYSVWLHRVGKTLLMGLIVIFTLGTVLHLALVGYIVTKGGKLEEYSFNIKDVENTASNVRILTERGEEIYTITNQNRNREYVTKEEIPQILKDAVVATEDKTYYKHAGVSIKGYLRAIYYKIINPSEGMHGGSTITQQLIKNINQDMYGRTVVHKYQEALVAINVENKYSKEEILEMYLNNIFLGTSQNGNLYGVQSASKYYFDKNVSELTISEAAYIAGLAKAPSTYTTQMDEGNKRKNIVLDLMTEYGAITQNQKLKEKEEIISLIKKSNANDKRFAAYADYVMHEIENKFGMTREDVFANGYTIRTYVNKDMQKHMHDTVKSSSFKDDKKGEDIVQLGMAAIDNEKRKIVGIYGGRNYEYGYQNRAYGKYQPGSILKPLVVYGPAFDSGEWDAYSKVVDEETDFGGYIPKNSNNKFNGEVTIEKALIRSLNIPAVKVLDEIGLDYGINTLSNLGVKIEEADKGLHIALGGMDKGVSPIEMAQAYSTFASFGYYEEANAVKSIEDENGAIVKKEEQIAKVKADVFKAETAYHLTEIMEKVITDENGTGGNANINRPVAGKTGTAQEPLVEDGSKNRAAWFVGYTPEFTLSVYAGFDKPTAQNAVSFGGGDVPAKLFGSIMKKQMGDYLMQDFQRPATVNSIYEVELLQGPKDVETTYNEEEGRVELTWTTEDEVSGITYKIYSKNADGEFVQIGKTNELHYHDYSISKENKNYKEVDGDWLQVAGDLWENTKITYENIVGEVKSYYIVAEYNGVESEKTKTEKKWIK